MSQKITNATITERPFNIHPFDKITFNRNAPLTIICQDDTHEMNSQNTLNTL